MELSLPGAKVRGNESSSYPDMDLNLQICCHQVAPFKAKMRQIRFRLGLRRRPRGGAYSSPPGRPLDGFELSNVN